MQQLLLLYPVFATTFVLHFALFASIHGLTMNNQMDRYIAKDYSKYKSIDYNSVDYSELESMDQQTETLQSPDRRLFRSCVWGVPARTRWTEVYAQHSLADKNRSPDMQCGG